MKTKNKLSEEVVLKDQYRNETGFDVYSVDKNESFTDEYVYWLQNKIIELQKLVKPKKNKTIQKWKVSNYQNLEKDFILKH